MKKLKIIKANHTEIMLLVVVTFLTILDAFYTFIGINFFGYNEGNPIMVKIMSWGGMIPTMIIYFIVVIGFLIIMYQVTNRYKFVRIFVNLFVLAKIVQLTIVCIIWTALTKV